MVTCIDKIRKRLESGESIDLRGEFCAHCHLIVASIWEKTAISYMKINDAQETYPCLRYNNSIDS